MSAAENLLHWTGIDGAEQQAEWRGSGSAPKRLREVDDALSADAALRAVSEGWGLVWRGDYHQARQLLQALDRRLQRPAEAAATPTEAFHQLRKRQAERARRLNAVLLPFEAGHHLPLRRAPEAQGAASAALDDAPQAYLLPLREWLGMVGAWEWQQRGLELPQLPGQHLHSRWGVFAPTRHEYLDLLLQAPLPAVAGDALDVGTGTGVIALLLAARAWPALRATDTNPRAIDCARENFERFGVRVTLEQAGLFGSLEQAALLVCNPPWLPGKVNSALDAAVYDPDSAMLRGFLAGARQRLLPGGEAWLIVSDLAELLGLRSRAQLLEWIGTAGLQVLGRLDAKPRHRKAADADDPLHAARAAETCSLWRLGAA